ncbi:MAG: methyltransferase domain-containing protein [Gammaproteobacteria bacterium]|nr:MAG: methyltransferase domain-containing protein [Gammaproteobacteria bacterium]
MRHIHARRAVLAAKLPWRQDFARWEESCVPSYCHPNLAAAYLSWARLYLAASLAKRHARPGPVLDFGAAAGELYHLLPSWLRDYEFIEENAAASAFLQTEIPGGRQRTLDSALDRHYAVVFALDSLEHNADYDQLLATLAGKLADDGLLIVSGPTESRLYRLGRRIAGFDAHYHETDIYAIEAAAAGRLERVALRRLPPLAPLFRITAWQRAA